MARKSRYMGYAVGYQRLFNRNRESHPKKDSIITKLNKLKKQTSGSVDTGDEDE